MSNVTFTWNLSPQQTKEWLERNKEFLPKISLEIDKEGGEKIITQKVTFPNGLIMGKIWKSGQTTYFTQNE